MASRVFTFFLNPVYVSVYAGGAIGVTTMRAYQTSKSYYNGALDCPEVGITPRHRVYAVANIVAGGLLWPALVPIQMYIIAQHVATTGKMP